MPAEQNIMGVAADFDRAKVRDIDIWDKRLKADPGETFVVWSHQDPFYILPTSDAPQAVVTRYEDARLALSDHARFSNVKRPWPGTERYYYWQGLPVVTDTDPPTHTKLRLLLSPAFSPRRLASVEEGVQAYVATLLDEIAAKGDGFDVMADFGRRLSVHMLLGLLMDIPEADRKLFVAVSDGLNEFASLPPGGSAPKSYLYAWAAARAYCEQVIALRRKNPTDDLVSHIITAHDTEGKLTTDELFATFVILYMAGLSGVAHLVGWMLWRLCRHPDQLKLLQDDPGLLNNAIEETLRIEPIGYTAIRFAQTDIELSGLKIHKNMPVHVIEGASNFDPEHYDDPLKFDITRKPRKDFLSFGYGVHHCIGAPVARLAARHAVAAVVSRFPNLHLEDRNYYPNVVGGPKDRGPASVPLKI